ncbi:hypothetical protein K469DRAFT_566036, partial [Zopfia rhizophila CBS 207.26]
VALDKCFNIVGKQSGFRDSYLGNQLNNLNMLEAMIITTFPSSRRANRYFSIWEELTVIDWDSIEDHEEWKTKPDCGPVNEGLAPVFASGGAMYHANFEPYGDSIAAFDAPFTQIFRFYFDGRNGEPPTTYVSDFVTKVLPVYEREKPSGFKGAAGGIMYEELEYEGVKGKAAVILIGWDDRERHKGLKARSVFDEVMGLMWSTAMKVEMHYVPFQMRHRKEGGE